MGEKPKRIKKSFRREKIIVSLVSSLKYPPYLNQHKRLSILQTCSFMASSSWEVSTLRNCPFPISNSDLLRLIGNLDKNQLQWIIKEKMFSLNTQNKPLNSMALASFYRCLLYASQTRCQMNISIAIHYSST